jgi:nitronate monooxygenase
MVILQACPPEAAGAAQNRRVDFSFACDVPVVQAPMAGGPSTPELTAAVAAAGGYGFVAGGYLAPQAFADAIDETKQRTSAPFGVNLFVPSPRPDDPGLVAAVDAYARSLRGEAERLDVRLGEPRWEDDNFAAKLDVALAARVHMVTFTFGCPDAVILERLHAAGILSGVTVTNAPEATIAHDAGADVLVVQGTEAGGHQATFGGGPPNTCGLHDAVSAVRGATPLPVIASGGIMTRADVRSALDAGAIAVQVGTALLCSPEAATSAVHRSAILDKRYEETVLTRAFSGRYARGLRNRFADEHVDAPAAYPQIHHVTRPLRAAATERGDPDVPNLWAGTGWAQVVAAPASDIVRELGR